MKPFSLLQALQNPPAPVVQQVKPAQEEIVKPAFTEEVARPAPAEPAKTSYQIYTFETEAGSQQIGVPLENVKKFDAYFEANPGDVADMEDLLEHFSAVVL